MSNDFDLLNEVQEAQTGFKQIGKLTISTKLMLWRDKKLEEASRADWVKADKSQRAMDTLFEVNIQEFKPQLGFSYSRKVRVGGLDWQKTLVPSIEALMGKDSMSEARKSETLMALNGKYVAVMDVPEQPRKNAAPDAKQYNTVKFVKVYQSREEALHDASEGFAGAASNGSTDTATAERDPFMPDDPAWSKDAWYGVAKGELVNAVSAAVNAAKTPPAKAKAKQDAIAKFAADMSVTVEQAAHLLEV